MIGEALVKRAVAHADKRKQRSAEMSSDGGGANSGMDGSAQKMKEREKLEKQLQDLEDSFKIQLLVLRDKTEE